MLKRARALKAKAAATKAAASHISPVNPPRLTTRPSPEGAVSLVSPDAITSSTASSETMDTSQSASTAKPSLEPDKLTGVASPKSVPTRKLLGDKHAGGRIKGVPLSIQLSDEPLPDSNSAQNNSGANNAGHSKQITVKARQNTQSVPRGDNVTAPVESMDVNTADKPATQNHTELKIQNKTTKTSTTNQNQTTSTVEKRDKSKKLLTSSTESYALNKTSPKVNVEGQGQASTTLAGEITTSIQIEKKTELSAEEAEQASTLEMEILKRKSNMNHLKVAMEYEHQVSLSIHLLNEIILVRK